MEKLDIDLLHFCSKWNHCMVVNIFSVGPCLLTVALFVQPLISESHILTGHSLIVDFCRRF